MDDQKLVQETKFYTRWAVALSLLLVVVWPGVMFLSGYVFSQSFFKGWVLLAFGWMVCAALFITIRPLIEMYAEYKKESL
jgi:uncharacterized membrane protein YhdT